MTRASRTRARPLSFRAVFALLATVVGVGGGPALAAPGGPSKTPRATVAVAVPHAEATESGRPRGTNADSLPAALRWADETPDAMVDDALARGLVGNGNPGKSAGAHEADVLAAALVIRALESRAENGHAEAALRTLASTAGGEVAGDLALMARALADDEATAAGTLADKKLGVVTELSVLGPFHDTGGGLDRPDGPEAGAGAFGDPKKSYAWGSVEVSWRRLPPTYATAAGVPLDVFIAPRTESCSFVASAVTVPLRQPVVLRVAATGSVRLSFDGVDVARDENVETSAVVDRLAARVDADAGVHLVAAKVCSGALADDGRVRIRITEPSGAPLALAASSDLETVTAGVSGPGRVRVRIRGRGPASSRGLPTALARTLAPVPHGADLGPELDAAVARTLGGADDSRSPRAPGLLDDLSRRANTSSDTLAMIGWISPSGANRSSLLNLALSRARSSGAEADPRVAAFAARRLIAQRLNAHLVDWAVATARSANLGYADAEAVLLHALLNDALGTDALRTQALRSLESVAASRPSATPTVVLRELVHLGATYDLGQALAAREVLAARGYRGHELVSALAARSHGAMIEAAKTALDGNLDDADDGLAVAEALSRAGLHTPAKAAYAQLARWAPNRPETWVGLAHELAAEESPSDRHAGEPGGEHALEAALRRARELAPSDAALRAELIFRQPSGSIAGAKGVERGEAPVSATAREDEKYLVAPEAFLGRRQGAPRSGVPDVADRELYWLRAVVLHPDRRVSQLIQYAREVVIPPRTQEDLVEDLPAEGDLTEILRARVYRKDGTTAFPTEQHDEGSRPSIRWPELEPGDTVEVALRTWTRGAVGGRGDAPFYFMDYAGAPSTHPLFYNEVVVEAPRASPLYLDVLHGDPDRRDEHDDGDTHVTRLIWDHPAVIPDEPLEPNLSEIAPLIVGSTFKDWAEFRSWYTGAIQGFSTPDDEVKRLAATLTRGKTTREAKLAALFDFVADDIRYVNFTSGEGWLPNRPQQLLARREGDCDDKAILLITLLRAVGIEAEEVMVQTRERGEPSVVLAKKAVIPMFDHGIAFLPGADGGPGQYLDATSPESRLGPLPSMDARAPAFRIEAGPAEMTSLPASSPAEHGSEVDWSITLRADGSGDLAGQEHAVGDAAFWLRSSLTQPDARADYVRDHLVEPWLPTVVVDKNVDFQGDLPRGNAWVKYSAHVSGLARREQGEMTLSVGQSQGLTSQLASLVTRSLPVVLPAQLAPSHQQRTTRLTAPAGFAWQTLPPGGRENGGAFGHAELEIARDPSDARTIVVKRDVVFDQSFIPAEKYPLWRAWLQRVDRLMHKEVRLVANGAHPAGAKP